MRKPTKFVQDLTQEQKSDLHIIMKSDATLAETDACTRYFTKCPTLLPLTRLLPFMRLTAIGSAFGLNGGRSPALTVLKMDRGLGAHRNCLRMNKLRSWKS